MTFDLGARDRARFEAKIERRGPDDCWPWTASRHPKGYGHFKIGGKHGQAVGSHRIAWELANGPAPAGLHVLHRCDNPPCCNPAHLWLGTNDDNVADKVAKGRAFTPPQPGAEQRARGEHHGNAKLTAAAVLSIRGDRRTQEAIAADYGVDRTLIGLVKRRVIWRHV